MNASQNPIRDHTNTLHLIADFNVETLRRFLEIDPPVPGLSVKVASFGQVIPSLLGAMNSTPKDIAFVWTLPERIASAFGDALRFKVVNPDHILSEVRAFADGVRRSQPLYRALFIVSWSMPVYHRGYGMLNLRNNMGLKNLLLKMNLELSEQLSSLTDVYLLDADRWVEAVGKHAYSPKLWYLTKTPFHADVFREAARDLKASLRGLMGMSKKLIIVDLDNTLWGGIVGDVGWKGLKIGGHDYLGEAFVDFQCALRSMINRGVLLAIVSKNEESIALEALRKHPEMVLTLEDFVAWRINWNDKAANIAELAVELNLSLQSIVFIDDNALERARIREAMPEVYVPEWPEDKTMFASYFLQLDCFDAPNITAEDFKRSDMYAANQQRQQLMYNVGSVDDWLRSLRTEITVQELTDSNRTRVIQLLNKTNQMNLTTRRMSENDLLNWLKHGCRKLWTFRVADRFGDSGLTGIMSLDIGLDDACITDFVLSCRVMGRKIEIAMVAFATQYCRNLGLVELKAIYLPTAKNRPCLDFWMRSGFSYNQNNGSFSWILKNNYPFPEGIRISSWNLNPQGQSSSEHSFSESYPIVPLNPIP